jgi:hypothetical protein
MKDSTNYAKKANTHAQTGTVQTKKIHPRIKTFYTIGNITKKTVTTRYVKTLHI